VKKEKNLWLRNFYPKSTSFGAYFSIMRKSKSFLLIIFIFLSVPVYAETDFEISTKDLIGECIVGFYDIKYHPVYFPTDVFTNHLEEAQIYVESGNDPNAVSKRGAKGSMQNTEISIKDICGYELSQAEIDRLEPEKRKKHIAQKKKGKPGYDTTSYLYRLANAGVIDYRGPKTISREQLSEVMREMFHHETSVVFRSLYLMMLFDEKYGYGVAREVYNAGDIEKTQFLLMAVYNGGKRRIMGKQTHTWPSESLKYAQNIVKNIKISKSTVNSGGEEDLLAQML